MHRVVNTETRMLNVILQLPGTSETREIRMAAMLMPAGSCHVHTSTYEGLDDLHQGLLRSGALPVGSVEFVRQAMALAGIQEPANLSYPNGCEPFLGRTIARRRAGSVIGRWFVKPVQTKLFNGFVFDTMQDPAALDEHDREQYDTFMGLDANTEVLISEPVDFRGEWRFYVDPRKTPAALAWARYDDHPDDDTPLPDINVVRDFVGAMHIDHPYAADFGVTSEGQTVLVEANDFWALGLYKGTESITGKAYLDLLSARWQMLLDSRPEREINRQRSSG